MGKRSRDKGARGEREAAHAMSAVTDLVWRRGVGQSRHGADVPDIEREDGGPAPWVEVKRGKRTNWRAAMKQADEATDGRPVLVLTRDDHGEWIAHLRVSDLRQVPRPYTLADHLTLTPLDEAGKLEGDDA